MTLDSSLADRDMSVTEVLWFRPQQTTQYYSYGWPNGISVDFQAAKYTVTASQSSLKSAYGAAISATDVDGNAGLEFAGGLLTSNVTKSVNISPADAVAKIVSTPADLSFGLTLTRATGAFAGTFTHTNLIKVPFQGVIYQKGANAGGYGFFLSNLPKVLTFNGESGSATLMAK